MESQQIMELLLAMNEKMATKEDRIFDREEMIHEMWADLEQRKAEREADREQSRADMEEIVDKMEERMTSTQAKADGKLKELTEPREEMMQTAGEHQLVPRVDAVIIPVRKRKRRLRGRKQAAGRHGEPKELTRGDHGSRKKLAAACRKASRCATVAWRKRNVFRKSWTHENWGPRKEVTASRKKVTRCARHRHKVQNKEKVAQRSPTGGAFESRCRRGPHCNTGMKDQTINGIDWWSPGERAEERAKWTCTRFLERRSRNRQSKLPVGCDK
jgi:ElaB/YqjD/DUF883 family membrane-anchored ribosome-binding protein